MHPNKLVIRKYRLNLPKARVLRIKVRRRLLRKLKQRAREFRAGEITKKIKTAFHNTDEKPHDTKTALFIISTKPRYDIRVR
ncbi:MAG: hypothetical protein A2939_00170 [Parcubacteria group bacterium RIFCSPLOWO2_01_FULL_48_18]|nr:MAG: hypothetical protein A3J67_05875 [Parcubacteria group bacterium RIFCSPHIGHO2_02_FULL_48_10b]OHB22181.1 MAG: hypothetical protein A2939_00170 [Parcubacteria group bacterium RIFCSPLOWO2_01_FULL_48_18]